MEVLSPPYLADLYSLGSPSKTSAVLRECAGSSILETRLTMGSAREIGRIFAGCKVLCYLPLVLSFVFVAASVEYTCLLS